MQTIKSTPRVPSKSTDFGPGHSFLRKLDPLSPAASEPHGNQEVVNAFDLTLNQAAIGMARLSVDGRFRWTNSAYADFVGYAPGDLLGMRLQDVLAREDLQSLETVVARLIAGEVVTHSLECRHRHSGGEWAWGSVNLSPVRDPRGHLRDLVMVVKDLSARKRQEELISRYEAKIQSCSKWSSLGEMAGNIAHEINNPLAIIHAKASQLARMASGGSLNIEKTKETSERIGETAMRISRIVRSLRYIAREPGEDPFQPTSLKLIVEDTIELCQERFRFGDVRLRIDPIPEDLTLECRAVEICQVLVNLLNNAYDAIHPLPDPWIHLAVADLGATLRISVTDSGNGIPPEIREKIFEPFFTTKDLGKGTGVGLSLARRILEAHHGTLRLDTDSPRTRFILELPRSREEQIPRPAPRPRA